MATLKAVVDHRKADGTYSVKIRLTHNRKSLYIPTSYSVTDRQLTKSKKIKAHDVLAATSRTIEEMRSIIMDVECVDVLPCDVLRDIINERMRRGKVFRLDFVAYSREKIKSLDLRNARMHTTAIKYLEEMFGRIDVNDITYNNIVKYRDKLMSKRLSQNTVSKYMQKVKHLLNLAKDEFNDDYETRIKVNPFKRDVIPTGVPTEHRVLSAEQIRRIASINGDRYENFARDVFLLSFCLIGVNMIDLYYMQRKSLDGDILTYNRSKTKSKRMDKAVISVKVEEEARSLIDKYKGDEMYLLNFFRRYTNHEIMTRGVNSFLKRFHRYDSTLPSSLTYYYARHSWATIAYNDCGIDMQTIHEALNHASDSSMRITDIYVKKDFTRIWEANRKVLDFVFGKEKTTP